MSRQFEIPHEEFAAYCNRWRVTELALFGSVLREDFGPESDVDVLVCLGADARPTLLDMARMQDELSRILGRQVDLVERVAIEASRNYIRRDAILRSAETVYAT